MIDQLCRWFLMSRREAAVLVAIFVVSLPAVTARIYASDEIEYFSYLRSLWFDHDVSFENEYRYFHDRGVAQKEGFYDTFLAVATETGRRRNFGTIGCALLWSPFYAIGDVTARAMRLAGSDVRVDGFSRPYTAAVAYGSAVYGFLAILLSIAAARRTLATASTSLNAQSGKRIAREDVRTVRAKASEADALFAGLAIWFGTPLLFYMYIAPPFSHACSAFAVAVFVTIWLRVRRSWTIRGTIALGLSAALMTMVREQDVFFALGPAVDFAIFTTRALSHGGRRTSDEQPSAGGTNPVLLPRRLLAAVAAGCVAFAVGIVPQLLAYSALNGYPGPSRLVTRKMTWTAPHAGEVLTSASHGFLLWTPIAILSIAGLAVLAWRGRSEARRIGAIALLMLALQVYVAGSVESWTVAGAYGQRRFVGLTILLTIGLAAVWRMVSGRSARAALAAVVVLCVWWNLALMAEFGTRLMNRQRLELRRNAYDAFVTLPRIAPELVWRYLTRRESFYGTAPIEDH